LRYALITNYALNKQTQFPIISGFFSRFIFYERQEKHEVTYCSPINQPPTSTEVATAILKATKAQFIISGFQVKDLFVIMKIAG